MRNPSDPASSTQAIQAFSAGFDQLHTATISPAQEPALSEYYYTQFAAEKKREGNEVDNAAVLPTGSAANAVAD